MYTPPSSSSSSSTDISVEPSSPLSNKSDLTKTQREVVGCDEYASCNPFEFNPFDLILTFMSRSTSKSAAYCNKERMSSSFLVLDCCDLLSLGNVDLNCKPREFKISIGKISYKPCKRKHSSLTSYEQNNISHGPELVVYQTLEKIPYSSSENSRIPLTHKKVAESLKLQNFDEAINIYRKIFTINKRRYGVDNLIHATDLHSLGILYFLSDDKDKALDYFQNSVSVKRKCPGNQNKEITDSLVEIGTILYLKGNFQRALAAFGTANLHYQVNPWNIEDKIFSTILNNIGCVHFALKMDKLAIQYLDRALTLCWNDNVVQSNICYIKRNRKARVFSSVEKESDLVSFVESYE